MINWGEVPAGSVLPFPFTSYGSLDGESITMTGFAVTDIEVYKGVSMTQRSSDAGYVLMDTDGTDIDGMTGVHGFSIDTGDNTDAGFYATGSFFWVIISAVTVDGQTVRFNAGTFRLKFAEVTAGIPAWSGVVPGGAGTAQSVASTSIVLAAASAFIDDGLNGSTVLITNGTQAGSRGIITTSSGDTMTIGGGWTGATPTGTPTYIIFGTAEGATGAGLDAAGVRAAVGLAAADLDTQLAAIEAQTDDIGTAGAGLTSIPWNAAWDAEVQSEATDALNAYDPPTNAEVATAISAALTATIADSIPADGTRPSIQQGIYMLVQFMLERSVSGTTATVRKSDGSTTLFTLTLNSATLPTSITRAT